MSRFLFTSDIHLSPRPRDAYRWSIFPWLTVQGANRKVDAIFILGDLTDQKDHHSNRFINLVVDALQKLREVCPVFLLKGNHDYSDPAAPLLRFFDGFFTEPTRIKQFAERILCIPHIQKQNEHFTDLRKRYDVAKYDLTLCHQTFTGAVSETGHELVGVRVDALPAPAIISGDVHVPQRIGALRYCGAPHPIHFGDKFQPRVLYWEDGNIKSVSRVTIQRASLSIQDPSELEEQSLTGGDQLKIRLNLHRSAFGDWEKHRKRIAEICKKREWELHGLELLELKGDPKRVRLEGPAPVMRSSPLDQFKAFCRANAIEKSLVEVGRKLLTGAEL